MEPFLKEYERNPSFKQAFDFKTKMFGSRKSHRTSIVPLFKLLDRLAEVKQQVDDNLDMSKAFFAPVGLKHVPPNRGWGENDVPAIFMPLLIHPSLEQEEEDLDLSGIDGLTPEVIAIIQGRTKDRDPLNREHAEKAIKATNGLFANMYWSLADFGNYTSNAISVSCACIQSLTSVSGDWSNRRWLASSGQTSTTI